MTAEKQSPFLSGGPTRRDRLPVLVGPLVGVLAALVCGISVLTGVVVVHNMQQELTGVKQELTGVKQELTGVKRELSVLQTENTGLRERLVAAENLLVAGTFAGHDRPRTVDESEDGGGLGAEVVSTSQDDAVRVKRQTVGSSGLFDRCAQGPPGRDGRDGPAGQPGTDGQTGRDGRDGVQGVAGPVGLQGPPGDKGDTGPPGRDGAPGAGGSVYIRWGRKTCADNGGAELVYSGVAGGEWYGHTGGGTNYQCLPTDPQWGRYQDGLQGNKAYMYGAEYELNTNYPFGSFSLLNNNVPCAVCYVPTRGSKLMIPARNTCFSGWTREYHGYLMTEYHIHQSAKEFVCVDEQPEAEAVPGGRENQDGALFYPVEARCGSLPCSLPGQYVEGRELTCVVCTK
ncbi:PREDICTED: uncharacterized protein LOC109464683 isoform X1 [Branchiostoma belcheri]|uniref:Uncharacterized protein LOC109464683 isoform X1 n=1 Tax=Branchiostoma belcheri TaxID=7741 RepID=A0A6P4YEV3_BRABE|nr:PREDICTED: uncharacterized protein LOC109464683 isoform X1 [Branchiostoma belcheri]